MNGSEKQVEWAENIIAETRRGIQEQITKWKEKVAKSQAKIDAGGTSSTFETNQERLQELEFYSSHIEKLADSMEDAKKVIDLREFFEKAGRGLNSRTAWDLLHYVGGIKEADLPEFKKG